MAGVGIELSWHFSSTLKGLSWHKAEPTFRLGWGFTEFKSFKLSLGGFALGFGLGSSFNI
jgi:hypothetical protein